MASIKFNKNEDYMSKNPHAMFATMKPFIAGAKTQLERYLEAQRIMKTHQTILSGGIDRCTYELSSLLEHLDSIEVQLRNRGVQLPASENIRQLRNHLRHDGRGEADYSKGKRGKNLGLDEKLQLDVRFTDSGVKMGSTELYAQQIDSYITSAETIMWALVMGGRLDIDGEKLTIYQQPATIKFINSTDNEA